MKATKLTLAAVLALATTGVFAETGVKTYQIDNVANVYGRTGVSNVTIKGDVQSIAADVANSGRNIVIGAGASKALVVTGELPGLGRS